MLESDVEMTVTLRAEGRGWFQRKMAWVGRKNAPDRFFARGGRVVLIEFKRPGVPARITQGKEHDKLVAAGVEVHVVDSIEQGDAILR
jgi:hypothetical protein